MIDYKSIFLSKHAKALARLRLAQEVSHEDVDEAIRLVCNKCIIKYLFDLLFQTHASKSSLFEEGPAVQQDDATSAIFAIIRDLNARLASGATIDFSLVNI